jgi:hypothetical protein
LLSCFGAFFFTKIRFQSHFFSLCSQIWNVGVDAMRQGGLQNKDKSATSLYRQVAAWVQGMLKLFS